MTKTYPHSVAHPVITGYSEDFKEIKDGQVFWALTKSGKEGVGKRDGYYLYFNDKLENIFEDPIARWQKMS